MFIIGEVVIEDQIARERFACDLGRCHGACCTLAGGRGAPLEDDELEQLSRAFPLAKQYLSEKHLSYIDRFGIYEGGPGNYTTTCIEDRDCVFVFYEEGVAKCSIERAYVNKENDWRKPLLCHLYPIRSSSIMTTRLRYDKISECIPAVERGEKENIRLYEFLKEPLIRKFGAPWYETFLDECRSRDTDGA